MSNTTVTFSGRRLVLSNLDKVLYPSADFTKAQVIDYYLSIAPVLMPHLKNRPLTLKRYPNGVESSFFYEKRCPSHRPQWLATTPVWSERSEQAIDFCVINGRAALAWVANLASIELHTYLFRAENLERPTMVAFDLDPGEGMNTADCARLALRLRELLLERQLQSLAKTSGGKGLHIYVPLNTAGATFDHSKAFARDMARELERQTPATVTSNMRKDLRRGRIFVDWSQNDDHKTTVCVYSLRARTRPTVSTPVTWDEVEQAAANNDPDALHFEAADVLERATARGDLFLPVLKLRQKLPKA